MIDDADFVLGQVTRGQMRAGKLWHRSVAILCRNSRGEIYVHRRTTTKDVFPGLYDMFVGGVVGAGESYAQAATREIGEELGIVGVVPTPLFHHRYEGPHSRAHTDVFEVTWDGAITHQASEVAWGAFRTRRQLLENTEDFAFVPDGAEIFERYCARYPE